MDRHFNRTDGFDNTNLAPRQGNFVQFDQRSNDEIFKEDPLSGGEASNNMYQRNTKNHRKSENLPLW